MKVHVVVGVYKGVLNSVAAFLSEDKAIFAHERVCRECDVPLFCGACGADSDEEHRKYKDSDTDNDVQHQIIDVEAIPIMASLCYALGQVSSGTERRLVFQEFLAAMNRRELLTNEEVEGWQKEVIEGKDHRFSLP